jgi:L-alanine-DL-glutamate epimerase-like enolase superfamily enzyme
MPTATDLTFSKGASMRSTASPQLNRRHVLASIATAGLGASLAPSAHAVDQPAELEARLRQIEQQPVLNLAGFNKPVVVESLELLRTGKTFLLRSRSKDGVEAVSVPHPSRTATTWPILVKNLIPAFVGQDARQLENLIWEAYRRSDNYKLQGLALWVGVAAIEINLLELLCRSAAKPIAELFGKRLRDDIPVYYASGNRGNTPEAEIEYLEKLRSQSGAKALKFRLGGRMSRNADSLPGRSEALIALARKHFGDGFTLYADSNSSYDAAEGIRIGRIMQDHGYAFYEEPCEFDDLWSTKQVADALTMPVAGGEQEFSMHRWRWMIANRGVDIVQPDLHYGGGLLRATRVARMAAAAGMTVVPHMSGGGLGYLDVVHFASFTPNIGPYQEFKGNTDLPVSCPTSSLKCENGVVRCPTGVGYGVEIDPAFIKKAEPIRL